jgi:hypothetical protein
MSQECYKLITLAHFALTDASEFLFVPKLSRNLSRVLRECYKSVTTVLQRCYKSVTRVLQRCYKSVRVNDVNGDEGIDCTRVHKRTCVCVRVCAVCACVVVVCALLRKW